MITLAYSDGKGITFHLLEEASTIKAKEENIKIEYFPERNIHPAFQGDIIDKYIKSNQDLIIVTHSEMFLHRTLRRIKRKEITNKD